MAEKPLLIVYKLAALLHDPAWKPWVVSAAFNGVGRVLARKPGSGEPAGLRACRHLLREIKADTDAHMLDAAAAAEIALEPLGDGLASEIRDHILDEKGVVSGADRFAAALDRWVLTYREKELKNVRVGAGRARYVNPLDPRFSYGLRGSISTDSVCGFVEKLRATVEALKDAPLPLVYNVLLFALEPLWYEQCGGCVPLADTRTPTHTVFDHVYAAASMINWLHAGGAPEGFMVKLDVAGIQEFISSARKTRDLWAGSWLVSALAWYTAAEAVMLLGADVVLSPYPLANHFFIATLLKELKDEALKRGKAREGLINLLLELEDLARRAFLWHGAANQPIAPGTFFLALPCIDEEEKQRLLAQAERMYTVDKGSVELLLDALVSCNEARLREYFAKRFREAWQGVAEAVVDTYKAKAHSRGEDVGGLAELLERAGALDGWDTREAGKDPEASIAVPPLRLRVIAVEVGKEYHGLLDSVRKALREPRGALAEAASRAGVKVSDADELARKLLLHYLFSKALPGAEERGLEGGLAIEPGYRIAQTLEDLTSNAFTEADRKTPGFHECSVCGRLPSIARIDENARLALQESAGIPPSMFTEGERLCPYCLIRRLMTLDEALENVMEALGLYKAEGARVYPRVPSTSELSAMSQYLALINTLLKERQLLDKIYESLERELGDRLEKAEGYVSAPLRVYVGSRPGSSLDDALKLLQVLGALEAYRDLSHLMASGGLRDTKACTGGGRREELCRLLAEAAKKAGVAPRRYYAVVRGDGDLFGSCIVRGVLDYRSAEEYVEKLLEQGIMDMGARRTLGKYYGAYARLLSLLAVRVAGLAEEPTVIVTPSYYAALSRGQMLTALYDAAIVAALGGFPVYAGGDDVAALVPGNMGLGQLLDLAEAWLRGAKKSLGRLDATPIGKLPMHLEKLGTGSVAAATVALTRMDYWGLLGAAPGFHVTPVGAVYAAPVAYGRSYGVYVAHYRDPFQAVWRAAGDLEELKDRVTVCHTRPADAAAGCKEECSKKDMVFLSYGRVSGIAAGRVDAFAVLPNLAPCATKDNAAQSGVSVVARPLADAARLLQLMEKGEVSRSLIHDFEREAGLAAALAERIGGCDKWSGLAAEKLALTLARRNSGEGASSTVERLVTYCSDAYVRAGAGAGHPLPWQLARSVKVLQAAGR